MVASCLGVGRPGWGALPRPTARPWGVRPGPATHWPWVRGGWAWGPVTNPTARGLASWVCALWSSTWAPSGRGGASGLRRSPSPNRPSVGRVAGARYPLAVRAVCRLGGLVFLGAFSCAALRRVLCVLPGFAAPGGRCCLSPVLVPWLWPRRASLACLLAPGWCAVPRPVRSLSALQSAFSSLCCLPLPLHGCAGHVEAGRQPGSLCLPLAPAEAGALGSLCVVPVRGPPGSVLGCVRSGCLACVDLVTDASGLRYRPFSDGRLGRCTVVVSCGHRHLLCGSEDATPGSRACLPVHAPLGRVGRASLPGAFLCATPFLWKFCPSSLFLAPSGLGLPVFWFFSPSFSFLPPPLSRPRCLLPLVPPAPGCPSLWRPRFAPPLFFVSFFRASLVPAFGCFQP